jgi:hypothetical protein
MEDPSNIAPDGDAASVSSEVGFCVINHESNEVEVATDRVSSMNDTDCSFSHV